MHRRDPTTDRRPNETSESDASADDSSNAPGAEDEPSEPKAQSAPGQLVLIPVTDYLPGLTVRVIDRLPASVVVRLLRLPNDETVPVLTRPDEFVGYVVQSERGDERVYSTTLVFTRESLEMDARYALEADAGIFSTRLNLFRATAHRVGPSDDDATASSERC